MQFRSVLKIHRVLVLASLMCLLATPNAQGQTLEEIDRYCGGPCTAAVQIENFTPGNSVFAFPLENEKDFALLQAFLKRNVPATVPLDISIVVPGDQPRTEISPISPSAIKLHQDLVGDREGIAMADSLGIKPATQAELASPINRVAEGLRQGYAQESTVQLVKVSPDSILPADNFMFAPDQPTGEPVGSSAGLNLADDPPPEGQQDPKTEGFWRTLRGELRANKGQLAASVILGVSVGAVNTATIMLNSGASLPQAIIVGGLMGTVTSTMNFWTVRLSRWYGNSRWVFQGEKSGRAEPGTFGRFLRMNSKRAFVGWTLGMVFRLTFRATGIMPGGPQLFDPVEVAGNTLYGVVNGYPWAKVTTNLARSEGKPLPGALKRLLNPATLSFILTLAYQAGSVLYHIPGHENTGRVVVGLISLAGVPLWIYQSVDVRKVVMETARRVKGFGRAVWCNILQGTFSFSGAY